MTDFYGSRDAYNKLENKKRESFGSVVVDDWTVSWIHTLVSNIYIHTIEYKTGVQISFSP